MTHPLHKAYDFSYHTLAQIVQGLHWHGTTDLCTKYTGNDYVQIEITQLTITSKQCLNFQMMLE